MNPQDDMTGTMAVPEKDKLDEAALQKWMEAHVEGFAGPLTLSKFKGGQSNPTYKIDTPTAAYVLRKKPFGKLLPSGDQRPLSDRLSGRQALWAVRG